MGYLFLILTILIESTAVILMKLSKGFEHKLYGGLAVLAYGLSFVFLTLALKRMPAGIANATWAGASTVLVAVLGMIVFKEQITVLQVIFFVLIITGIAGLNYTNPA